MKTSIGMEKVTEYHVYPTLNANSTSKVAFWPFYYEGFLVDSRDSPLVKKGQEKGRTKAPPLRQPWLFSS